ncbi:MAG TPA: HAD family phosphatase [Burkholderiaceae bacterium]|nr:HAD family phosphatase [Burkholderiaceae bacterium]
MKAKRAIDAIVFDLGGVVLRWRPAELLAQALPALADTPQQAQRLSEHFFQTFGPEGDWAQFDRGTLGVDDVVGRIVRRTGLAESDVRAVVAAVPAHLQPQPEAVALIDRLRSRWRLHYLSNMPEPFARRLLDEHRFFDWFDGGVFSSLVRMIKPERPIFDEAARRFGAEPSRLLFIDDSPVNVEAARAAGWQAMHFVDVAQCRAQLAARGVVPDPA